MGKIFYIMGKSAVGKDKIYSFLAKDERLHLKRLIPYTTRPIRAKEENGKQYYFTDEKTLEDFRQRGKLIEARSYQTTQGVWTYFTADDGQVDLSGFDYLAIGTLESFSKMKAYYGEAFVVPVYIQVEDGDRLERALIRERKQEIPLYAEVCRRYLADEADFSEENIQKSGIRRRFENAVLNDCVEEIAYYIKSLQ